MVTALSWNVVLIEGENMSVHVLQCQKHFVELIPCFANSNSIRIFAIVIMLNEKHISAPKQHNSWRVPSLAQDLYLVSMLFWKRRTRCSILYLKQFRISFQTGKSASECTYLKGKCDVSISTGWLFWVRLDSCSQSSDFKSLWLVVGSSLGPFSTDPSLIFVKSTPNLQEKVLFN